MFIDYKLKIRDDWEYIEKGIKSGVIEIEFISDRFRLKVKDKYNRWHIIYQLKEDLDIDWLNYRPKQIKNEFLKRYNLTKDEVYIDYFLKYHEQWNLFKEALELGIIVGFKRDVKNVYHKVKCRDTGKIIHFLLKDYPKPIPREFFLNFNERYRKLSPEEIANRIESLTDSPTRDEYFRLKAKVKNWKNGTEEDLMRLEEIAVELGVDIEIHNGFIMKYDEAKEIMDGEVKLEVFEEPIVLTEENLEETILGHSIVWDLYDVDEEKSIYVGECRSGQYELEALKLYVNQDKEGTIERRFREYGYGGNQLIVERIFERNFVVRLLAIGEDGECKFVRAYESVWNTECNDGEGCLEKTKELEEYLLLFILFR